MSALLGTRSLLGYYGHGSGSCLKTVVRLAQNRLADEKSAHNGPQKVLPPFFWARMSILKSTKPQPSLITKTNDRQKCLLYVM